MPRPGATAPAARLPETPEAPAENSARANFIAAARKASQSASGGQSTGLGASEPEINDDTPRSDARPADQAPKSRIRRLLGAALIVLAIGGAILALPLVTGPSTPPSTQANRTMGQADTPASGQAGTGQSGTGQPATGMSQADQEPDTVGAIGPAVRSSLPGGKPAADARAQRHRRDIAAQQAAARGQGRQSRRGVRGGAHALRTARACPATPRPRPSSERAASAASPRPNTASGQHTKRASACPSTPQAKNWYRPADRGKRAMHNLGVLLAEGTGGEPDYEAAASGSARPRISVSATASTTSPSSRRAGSACSRASRSPTPGSRWPPPRATRTPSASATSGEPPRRDDAGHGQGRCGRLQAWQARQAANDIGAPAGGWETEINASAEREGEAAQLRPRPATAELQPGR